MKLTSRQLEEFDRDGCLFFPGLFTAQEIKVLIGASAERVWVRDDVEQAGAAAQSADGRGHTVVRDGDGLALLTFDAATGDSIDSQPLPDVVGTTVGTSVGPDGQVVTASYLGEIFTYTG